MRCSPDNWQTVYRQPAFYYQSFWTRRGQGWFYPAAVAWKCALRRLVGQLASRLITGRRGTTQFKPTLQRDHQ
jgi:hypothetical protein